jgi:L-rhamnose isomerase
LATWTEGQIEKSYQLASERYAAAGVDCEAAMRRLATIPISLHCWQGDDVAGFEVSEGGLSGGLAVTGNYPGRARNAEELRADLEKVYSLLPGRHRLNLHALYAETGGKVVDRDKLETKHFRTWIDWAKEHGLGLDFNPSCFSHPKSADGFTLSHPNESVRQFWIEHCRASRRIAADMGGELGSACVNNVWIPDGYKDIPVDRNGARQRLRQSLDQVFAEKLPRAQMLDAVESKLFGIGSESCVIGSHEFYLGYAVRNEVLLCLDAGHFHPTEVISDKVSSVLTWMDEILLHVSRGVRWDSDHVVILSDELRAIAEEIVRPGFEQRVHIGLDFFDASINRVAAWTIGTRSMLKALLIALLEPTAALREMELSGDFTSRLGLLEEQKMLPFGAVWDYYCLRSGTVPGAGWLDVVKTYETKVLSARK